MQDFRNLQVWGKAHRLTLAAYRVTVEFPRHELYGLVSQVRRSSASIATNIAEGCGRRSDADFRRFVAMALASASEVEYQFLLAHDLGYLEETKYRELDRDVVEVKRMLTGLMKKIASDRLAG